MISEESKRKLRRLLELRERRDQAKVALEEAERNFRDAEADVYEAMAPDENGEGGIKGTIKVPLGPPWGDVSFRTRETYYGRIIDDEAALEYFERRAMTDEVSAPKFVKARINEIVRDCIEQGAEMPPGIDYYPQRGITITRQKGSK